MRKIALFLLFPFVANAQISVNEIEAATDLVSAYAPPAGTSRLLVANVAATDDGTLDHPQTSITGVNLGATALTLDGQASRYLASPDDSYMTAIASLKEADLLSDDYSVTFDQAPELLLSNNSHVISMMLEGVDQTAPLVDFAAGTWTTSGGAAPTVDVVEDGIVIYVERGNASTDWNTVAAGYTQAYGSDGPGNGAVVAYKLISADGTENPTIAGDHAAQGSYVIASYRPVTASSSVAPLAAKYYQDLSQ